MRGTIIKYQVSKKEWNSYQNGSNNPESRMSLSKKKVASMSRKEKPQLMDAKKGCIPQVDYKVSQLVKVEFPSGEEDIQLVGQSGTSKYTDTSFPLTEKSLYFSEERYKVPSYWSYIEWARASQRFNQPQIFMQGSSPHDVKQGSIGNCYLMAALAALAEQPGRVDKLLLRGCNAAEGYFRVGLLYRGRWKIITIDDYFPFLGNTNLPMFAHTRESQLWVMIIEKAYAKLYKNYWNTHLGHLHEALHDLTGAPVKRIFLFPKSYENPETVKQNAWKELEAAVKNNYPITAKTNQNIVYERRQNIQQAHAYTVQRVDSLFSANYKKLVKFVKLRNPDGHTEFNGQFSDFSSKWDQYFTKEQQESVGFYPSSDQDGVFFIPYDYFWEHFTEVDVAEVIANGGSYDSATHQDNQQKGAYFAIDVPINGQYNIQVDNPIQAALQPDVSRELPYQYAGYMTMFEMKKNEYGKTRYIDSFYEYVVSKNVKKNLQAGTYIISIRTSFMSFDKEKTINLAVYSEIATNVRLATSDEARAFEGRDTHWNGGL